ncbi:MAG: urea ABC transporter permease subunit UrtB, partial [Burkholderiales bacterium]
MLRFLFEKFRLAVLLSFAVVLPVQALEADAVKGLASDDLATRIQAIDDIAAAGDEAALELLQALYNGEVYVTEDGQVVLEEDEIVDALTHEALDPEPEFYDSVIVNNRMRGNLETAIAALSLLSDDHETRMASATALEGAEDPKLLPVLKKALDKETDPEIRAMLGQTKAVIELGSADPTVRLEAAHALSDSSQRRVRELLSAKLEKTPDGEFIEPVEEVRDAAEEAMKSIDRRLLLIDYLGRFFSGLSLGSILLLVALGLAIIYGLLGVINLAHGELLMIGAYATYVTQSVFRTYFPESLDFYVVAAIPVAFIVTGGVGVVLERTVIR